MWSSSPVAFALLLVLMIATVFFYVLGHLQGHDSWVDEICRNARTFYYYDACGSPEYLAIASAGMVLIYLMSKWYSN